MSLKKGTCIFSYAYVCVGERESKREIEGERQAERWIEGQIDRKTGRQTEKKFIERGKQPHNHDI